MPPSASSNRQQLARDRLGVLLDYSKQYSKLHAPESPAQLALKGGFDGDDGAFVLHEAVLRTLVDATLENGEKCVFLGTDGDVWMRLRRPDSADDRKGEQGRLLCAVYATLFAAHQEALREGRGAQVTVGVGIVRWKRRDGHVIDHPLITLPAELTLDVDGALVVRMADGAQATLWRMPGVTDATVALDRVAESASKYPIPLLGSRPPAPADRDAWEPLLKRATYELAHDASYVGTPPRANARGVLMGAADATLRIHNGFVLWARHEAGELGVARDVDLLNAALWRMGARGIGDDDVGDGMGGGGSGDLPASLARLVGVFGLPVRRVKDEGAEQPRGWLASVGRFLGFGASSSSAAAATGGLGTGFLHFGLPSNPQQEMVIGRLKQHGCCVLVGPPGTGKSQTIANVICHYLATGRRVLVTSKGPLLEPTAPPALLSPLPLPPAAATPTPDPPYPMPRDRRAGHRGPASEAASRCPSARRLTRVG
jgi:hypothetical protein